MPRNSNSRREPRSHLVYSSDGGRVDAPGERRSTASRRKQKGPATPDAPDDGIVRVSRSSKGRKGKGVPLVTGLPLQGEDLKELARQLKQKCGSGGTLRENVVEIQGDHREALVAELSRRGYTVKRAGG